MTTTAPAPATVFDALELLERNRDALSQMMTDLDVACAASGWHDDELSHAILVLHDVQGKVNEAWAKIDNGSED